MAKQPNFAKFFQRAEEAIQRRNYDLAMVQYEEVLRRKPTNMEALTHLRATQHLAVKENGRRGAIGGLLSFFKGLLLNMIGKPEDALMAYHRALKSFPTTVIMLKAFAKAAEKAELLEVAAWERREIADKYDPDDINNLWQLGELYQSIDNNADAVMIYERIREIDDEADVDSFIREASAQMSSTHFATAVEHGARSALKDDDQTEVLEMDAAKLRNDIDRQKVIDYRLSHDAVERPDDYRVYAQVANIYYDFEDFQTGYTKAKEFFAKAMELNSTDSSLRDRMGDLEIKAYDLRLQAIQKKRKAAPDDAKLDAQYKNLYRQSMEYKMGEYERRVKEQPLKVDFHYRLGELYFVFKRFDDAVGELQQTSKDPKFRLSSLTMLGRCFCENNQLEMAITQFQRAQEGQEIFTKIREPLYFEAETYERIGTPEALQKALSLYTRIYEEDINFREVKNKVPAIQKRIKEEAEA